MKFLGGRLLLLDLLCRGNLLTLGEQLRLLGGGGGGSVERCGALRLGLGGNLDEGCRGVLLLLLLFLRERLVINLLDGVRALANLVGDALGEIDLGEALLEQCLDGAHLLRLLLLEPYLLLLHGLEHVLSLLQLVLGSGDGFTNLRRLRLESDQLRVSHVHALLVRADQVAEQVHGVALAGAAVLHGGNVADDLVLVGALVLLERHVGVGVVDRLQLSCVCLHLLSEVLDALGDVLRDAEVVLDPLHGGARLSLLKRIGGEGLMRVHQLLHLLFFEVDAGLLAVVVCHFFVIVVVSRLLVLLDLVDWRLLGLRGSDAGHG